MKVTLKHGYQLQFEGISIDDGIFRMSRESMGQGLDRLNHHVGRVLMIRALHVGVGPQQSSHGPGQLVFRIQKEVMDVLRKWGLF